MQKSTVTLSDIAKELGTSVNTVSRALRDCSDIGEATKEKVRLAAEYMGYVPNKIASFLRSKRSNIVSVVISSLTNPFFSICIEHMLDYMVERDFRALIMVKKGNLNVEASDVVQCIQNGACGILSFLDVTDEAADYCEKNKIPFLVCGLKPRGERVSAIYSDDSQCGETVARAALASGAARPCYVANRASPQDELDGRGAGYAEVLRKNGLGCDIYNYDYYAKLESQETIRKAVYENGNDFIFCYNDEMAMIVLKAFEQDKDFRVPVYGVDRVAEDLSYCRGIKSVGAKPSAIGRRCAQLLLRNIEKYDGKVIKELLPVELSR